MEKVVLFLFVILGGVISGVLMVNPEGMEKKVGEFAPMFEFRSYAYYNITQEGVQEFLLADEGYRYWNMDLLTGVRFYFKSRTGVDTIKGHTAYVLTGTGITDFNGSIIYERSDGSKLESRDVRYNKGKSTIAGGQPFVLTEEGVEFRGERFWVDTKNKILRAERIKSWFLVEDNTSSKVEY